MESTQSLRELRKAQGLTQEELGAILNVSGKTISRWETQLHQPTPAIRWQYAKALGITVTELWDHICDDAVT
jgi:transcriptional regulator with XRE-family HTH domain